jgi:hypothetical protein
MKRVLLAGLLFVGLGLAQKNLTTVLFAEDLERTPYSVELGPSYLTELVFWLPIEGVSSARGTAFAWQVKPGDRATLRLTAKPGITGSTDLVVKVEGRTLFFNLVLGSREGSQRLVVLAQRPRPGASVPEVIVREAPAPQQAQPAQLTPAPVALAAPAAPAERPRKAAYFGLSAAYPPIPVQGSLTGSNLLYGMTLGLEDLFWGLDAQVGMSLHPASGATLFEGLLVKGFSPQEALNFYLGLGGGVVLNDPVAPFAGGVAGVDFRLGDALRPYLELTPRLVFLPGGPEVIVGGRLGLKVRP